jgi:hypothetical protein
MADGSACHAEVRKMMAVTIRKNKEIGRVTKVL